MHAHMHTHTVYRAATDIFAYLRMLEYSALKCTMPRRDGGKDTKTLNYVKHDFSFSITFISIILLLLQEFPSALHNSTCCLHGKPREPVGWLVRARKSAYLYCYTNGALSISHTVYSASHSALIVQNIFSVNIIVCEQSYIVHFGLNSCTCRQRLVHCASAQLLQIACETTSCTSSYRPGEHIALHRLPESSLFAENVKVNVWCTSPHRFRFSSVCRFLFS